MELYTRLPDMANFLRLSKFALIIGILVIAAFFRFYLITEIPAGLYPDEAANGNNALEALRTGSFKIFYPENNGREGLFINLQAISIKLLGAEPWALRVVSAIFGTLTVFGIYLLTKELFNSQFSIFNFQSSPNYPISPPKTRPAGGGKRFENWKIENYEIIALLSSFFLAASYWHINFSRIGFRAIMVPFFAVFGMYWLLKALRTGKISSAILAGIATGLGFHTYIAFRFMPFVMVVPILFSLRQWFKRDANTLMHANDANHAATYSNHSHEIRILASHCMPCLIALFLLVTFLAALPIGLYFLNNPQDFFGRGGQVSIFSGQSPAYEFIKSTVLTLGMFNIWGDCNQRHNLACQPQLFWPVGILFAIGLIITVRNLFQKPLSPIPYTLSAWFIFLMLPATLTREGLPHALRSIGLIPPVMIFAGLGGIWLWQKLIDFFNQALTNPGYQKFQHQILRIKKELTLAALLLLILIPIATYRGYFVRFAYSDKTAGAFAVDLWQQGRYLAGLPLDIKKIVIVNLSGDDIRGVPAPAQTIMFATDTFDEVRRRSKGLSFITRLEEIRVDAGEKVIILAMNPQDQALGEELRNRYPELVERKRGSFLILANYP